MPEHSSAVAPNTERAKQGLCGALRPCSGLILRIQEMRAVGFKLVNAGRLCLGVGQFDLGLWRPSVDPILRNLCKLKGCPLGQPLLQEPGSRGTIKLISGILCQMLMPDRSGILADLFTLGAAGQTRSWAGRLLANDVLRCVAAAQIRDQSPQSESWPNVCLHA